MAVNNAILWVKDKPQSPSTIVGCTDSLKGGLSVKHRPLDANRAKSATPENVDGYFSILENFLHENNLTDKPQFIYNVDETGIQPEHRPPNVLPYVNKKPQAVTSPRLTSTT